MRRKLSWKKSVLVICKILGLSVNTLATDDKLIHIQLPNKRKSFVYFFLCFWNVDQILNILKKKMTLIADVFTKILITKDMVT